jgi:hypothetical protein
MVLLKKDYSSYKDTFTLQKQWPYKEGGGLLYWLLYDHMIFGFTSTYAINTYHL